MESGHNTTVNDLLNHFIFQGNLDLERNRPFTKPPPYA